MAIVSSPRFRRLLASLLIVLGGLTASGSASAAVERFYRFEENATANWIVTEDCPDGTQAQTRVTVIAGRELESPDLDTVNTFATLLIRSVDCSGRVVTDRGSGTVTYSSSPSLQHARVTGTVPLRSAGEASIDVSWSGSGPLETTVYHTRFEGFVGVFKSRLRQAEATGTVAVNGVTLVSGPAASAEIETLEDRNTTL
jgi:hypothetical protein